MSLSASLEARDSENRRGRELLIWRFRCGVAVFATLQTLVDPGDTAAVGWSVVVVFATSVLVSKVVIGRVRSERGIRRLGLATMIVDWVLVAAVLSNDLTDAGSPVYLVAVLALLECTMRWPTYGGVIGGLVAGLAAASWTVLVYLRSGQPIEASYATMRLGALVVLGGFFGALTRRLSDQHRALERVLDTSRDLIVTVGTDQTILAASAACEVVLGHTSCEMVGRPWSDFLDVSEDRELFGGPVGDGGERHGEPAFPVRRFLHADGRTVWLELSVTADPAAGRFYATGRDVTERVAVERQVAASEQRFRSLFDHNPDPVYSFDPLGRFTSANPATQRLIGYSIAELLEMPFHDLVAPEDVERAVTAFTQVVSGHPQHLEVAVVARGGHRLEVDVTAIPIVVDGEVVGVFVVSKDITERRLLERELAHRASHDALTGLPNRAWLESALEEAMAAGRSVTLLFVDLDRFKVVNDSLGHRCGDELLVRAAERLSTWLRNDDLLVRWAGDEFCVLLANETNEVESLAIADRLLLAVAQPFMIEGREIRLSASVGIAHAGRDGTPERLVQMADTAMYQAKRAGRNRVSIFDSEGIAEPANALDYEIELRRAVNDDLLSLEYQPVVEVATGRIVAVECLLRWRLPDGSSRPPDEFIAVAEESGLIRDITRWVLRRACLQLHAWDVTTGTTSGMRVWVNVSGVDLQDPDLVLDVEAALEAASLPPERLVLEVTESTLLLDIDQVDRTVDGLRRLGVALAIDDFGTGYSSMAQLHRLRVAACKIDRKFVAEAPSSERDAAVIQSLSDLGRVFGFDVVGEGVETLDQLRALQAVGCRFAQGYLFARPSHPDLLLGPLIEGRIDVSAASEGTPGGGRALPSAG